MLGQRIHSIREYQSSLVDPAARRFLAQIADRCRNGFRKPQHTVLAPSQYSHPAIKDVRCELEAVVEAAKHESRSRQAEFLASEVFIGDRVSRIERHEAA